VNFTLHVWRQPAGRTEGRFVTYVLAIIDLETHEMTLVNAGHMSPIIRRSDGTWEEFDDNMVGVPLGVVEGFPFESVQRDLAPGETVVIFTDGVSEAMNPQSELYGMDPLRQFICRETSRPAELGKRILEDVRRHAAGREQNDDITLMVFGRV
jgi:phosphoserine phosphatase RsbU/P